MNLKKTVWAFLGNRLKDSQKEYLIKIDRFFQSLVDFFIKIIKNIKPFLKLLIIIIATICFYINRFRQKRIYNHVGFGHKDLVAEATIIEFFVWDSAFDKSRSFSSTAKKSLFLVGSFCLKRGFYIRYYKVLSTLPHFTRVPAFPPIWKSAPLIISFKFNLTDFIESFRFNWVRKLFFFLKKVFYNKRFPSDIIDVYYVDVNFLLKILRFFRMRRFVSGRISALFFSFSDDFERIFVTRRWVHNFFLEITWAVVPTFVVFLIMVPSLALLYMSESIKFCEFFITVTANQWYWVYSVDHFGYFKFYESFIMLPWAVDSGDFSLFISSSFFRYYLNDYNLVNYNPDWIDFFRGFIRVFVSWFKANISEEFESYVLDEFDLSLGRPRLLETTRHLVAPSDTPIRFVISSVDVLHSFALPSLGLKVDAVTGRLNTASVLIYRAALFTGQCSELCGTGHFSMPIVFESFDNLDYWSFYKMDVIQNGESSLEDLDYNLIFRTIL